MIEKRLDVAIQGIAGCFHDAAARAYFNASGLEVNTVGFDTFPDMFDALAESNGMVGIVAIENTIAGALLANHELLRQSPLSVVG